MRSRRGYAVVSAVLVAALGAVAPTADAGPWSQLPDAIDRLAELGREDDPHWS